MWITYTDLIIRLLQLPRKVQCDTQIAIPSVLLAECYVVNAPLIMRSLFCL